MNRRTFIKNSAVGVGSALLSASRGLATPAADDSRLKGAFLRPAKNGWTFVHLEGSPFDIGYQHGYLLPERIEDGASVFHLEQTHDGKYFWDFFREKARTMMWAKIEDEYQEELRGIAEGLRARGSKMDLWDVVALNGGMEWGYYTSWFEKQQKDQKSAAASVAERCSAFAATGSYTKDGRVVLAHNNWSPYLEGERWTIIYDIQPEHGYRFIMDGYPGFIHSGDDFGVNAAGIMITETTISHFSGYDPMGIPEFVRARKAMQYSTSIDDFARIMKEGNNGGYANNWLVADRKNNEVADLELGLKNVNLWRSTDGYFVGSNFPVSPELAKEETDFPAGDMGESSNARHVRWEQLMAEHKGKIDSKLACKFLADHYDTFEKKHDANERTLCGHIDLSPRGSEPWMPPYGIAGAVQNKVSDAAMCERLTLLASAGHCCGMDFKAAEHLREHPQFDWQKPLLTDMDSYRWTAFSAASGSEASNT